MLTKEKGSARRTNREIFRQRMVSLRVRSGLRFDLNKRVASLNRVSVVIHDLFHNFRKRGSVR